MAAPKGLVVQVIVDQKALDRAIANVAKYEAAPLHRRAQQAYLAGARMLVPAQRRAAAGMFKGHGSQPRRMTSTIRARKSRLRSGEMAAVTVGPTSGLRAMVIRGTRPHSLAPVRPGKSRYLVFPDGNVRLAAGVMHPGAAPRPFVDAAYREMGGQVRSFIERETLDIGMTRR